MRGAPTVIYCSPLIKAAIIKIYLMINCAVWHDGAVFKVILLSRLLLSYGRTNSVILTLEGNLQQSHLLCSGKYNGLDSKQFGLFHFSIGT